MRSWRAPGGVCVACGGLWAGDPRRCLVQEGWAWRQGGEEALGLERGSDHWVWLLLGVIRERREWGPGGEATPGPGACLSGDWAGGENVWPQTGTERLLYAAPPLVTEHHPPRARTPAGGEGGHPSGAGCVEGSSAGGRLRWAWAVGPEAGAHPPPWYPLGLCPELSPPRCSLRPCRDPPRARQGAHLLLPPQPQDMSHLPWKSQGAESRGVS